MMLAFLKGAELKALAIAVASWTAVWPSLMAKLTPHVTGVPESEISVVPRLICAVTRRKQRRELIVIVSDHVGCSLGVWQLCSELGEIVLYELV
jgi:hypothetical protein